jgi:hypothetical protein
MNDINAATRLRVAAADKAEAAKITVSAHPDSRLSVCTLKRPWSSV